MSKVDILAVSVLTAVSRAETILIARRELGSRWFSPTVCLSSSIAKLRSMRQQMNSIQKTQKSSSKISRDHASRTRVARQALNYCGMTARDLTLLFSSRDKDHIRKQKDVYSVEKRELSEREDEKAVLNDCCVVKTSYSVRMGQADDLPDMPEHTDVL